MKTQKLQFALAGLYGSQKKKKNQKLILRKILIQIFKCTKCFYLLLFINNSNNSRYTSSF